jgi:hypothetical protein
MRCVWCVCVGGCGGCVQLSRTYCQTHEFFKDFLDFFLGLVVKYVCIHNVCRGQKVVGRVYNVCVCVWMNAMCVGGFREAKHDGRI